MTVRLALEVSPPAISRRSAITTLLTIGNVPGFLTSPVTTTGMRNSRRGAPICLVGLWAVALDGCMPPIKIATTIARCTVESPGLRMAASLTNGRGAPADDSLLGFCHIVTANRGESLGVRMRWTPGSFAGSKRAVSDHPSVEPTAEGVHPGDWFRNVSIPAVADQRRRRT